ncbi:MULTISPECIES: cyclodeaminase/cyclohydrolase family protein [Prauserella salsuginis group]|uniref:Cyclodeaminase/cyclohydrolase family protein n=1 Tax=Prauserella salsuginis TaxID=387889 RepID=A0ABW6G0S3_9PSEU|nr:MULTISPECIES: cyclodeaminase/cyclohydrolase family protein [Prauserella salsuginis group]MCR3721964.1 Formiminotetrahydrofolate cyclodeaminase [Prauserella flava]MCR3735970.1 Formiminotetrahydrofolate cyclodeaminase [Prauserella salsuginis]
MTDHPLVDATIGSFLDGLAARRPAPGGGATAALHAAQAAALISMVARYSVGEKYADVADFVGDILEKAESERCAALRLAADDAVVFTAVTDAYRLPRDTEPERAHRTDAIAKALVNATGPPAGVIRTAANVMSLAEDLLPAGNRNVITDIAAASEAARAAATTARLNVEINLGGIRDEKVRVDLWRVLGQVDDLARRAAVLERSVRAALV